MREHCRIDELTHATGLYRGTGRAAEWPSLPWLAGIGTLLLALSPARLRKTIAQMA